MTCFMYEGPYRVWLTSFGCVPNRLTEKYLFIIGIEFSLSGRKVIVRNANVVRYMPIRLTHANAETHHI